MKEAVERWATKLGLETRPRLRKTLVAIIGATVFLIGIALLVLPGPAILVIPVGLAILATEFAWASRVMKRGRLFVQKFRRNGTSAESPNESFSRK
jgi:Putative transmembrane protein (PGPGW)